MSRINKHFGPLLLGLAALAAAFPAAVARIVAMFCWASGAVLEAAIGAYRKSN